MCKCIYVYAKLRKTLGKCQAQKNPQQSKTIFLGISMTIFLRYSVQ